MFALRTHLAQAATARRIVWFLLAAALAIQIGYALNNQAPPIWDETGHTRATLGLLNVHSFADAGAALRAALRYGLIYPLWLASIYAPAGENFFLARLLQGIVAVGALAFLYLGARTAYGKRAGIATLTLGVLYLPFAATAARLLSETLALFWLTGALWLAVRGVKRDDARALLLAGFVSVMVGLTRPTLQMLFVALAVGVFAALWLNQQKLRGGAFFVAGVCLAVIPFLLFTGLTLGRATLSGSVSPFEGIFVGNYIPDGGYPTDTRSFLHEYPQPEFAYVRAAQRAPQSADFARVTWQVAARDPFGFSLLQARKLFDQWRAPFNDFEIDFGMPYAFQEIVHALVILLGAVGALAFWKKQPLTLIPAMGWLYLIAANLIVPVERRYALPGIPFALMLAGPAVENLAAVAARQTKLTSTFVWALASVGVGALILFGAFQFNRPAAPQAALTENRTVEIALRVPAALDEFTQAALYVDGKQLEANALRARQDNRELALPICQNRVFENSVYATLLERRGRAASDIAQWFCFDLDLGALAPNSELRVSIRGPAVLTQAPFQNGLNNLPALDTFQPNNNTSLYKYLADDDFRIPRVYALDAADKISDSPYRVLLVLTRADGTQKILW